MFDKHGYNISKMQLDLTLSVLLFYDFRAVKLLLLVNIKGTTYQLWKNKCRPC